MGSGIEGITFSHVINLALYGISGFFFGIFASRNSLFSVIKIRSILAEKSFSPPSLFILVFNLLFLILAFLVFPAWMSSRTIPGAFVYYAVLLFYFSKGWKNLSAK